MHEINVFSNGRKGNSQGSTESYTVLGFTNEKYCLRTFLLYVSSIVDI